MPSAVCAQQWFSPAWSHRREIIVDNTANPGTLTDYQVSVELPFSAAMQADFDDVRFCDEDGTTQLDYWTESVQPASAATFWVKCPQLPAQSQKTIYAYYGNANVPSTSNGSQTFMMFDDAEQGTPASKWEVVVGDATPEYETVSSSKSGCWYGDGDFYHGPMGTYPQWHRPMAVYAQPVDKTYFVFGNRLFHAMIMAYDHASGTFEGPLNLGTFTAPDAHMNPGLFIDEQGYIYVFFGSHNTTENVVRSSTPYNISSFTIRASIPFHSYPQTWQLQAGEIFHLHRGQDTRSFNFRTSVNSAASWSAPTQLTSFSTAHWTYPISIAENGTYPRSLYVVYTIYNSTIQHRRHIYFTATHDAGQTWVKSNASPVTLPITSPTVDKVWDSGLDQVNLSDIQLDEQGNVYVLFNQGDGTAPNSWTWRILRFDGAQWTSYVIPTGGDHHFDIGGLVTLGGGQLRAYLPSTPSQPGDDGGDIEEWESLDSGQTWNKLADLTQSSSYSHNFIRTVLHSDPAFRIFWSYGDSRIQPESTEVQLYLYGEEQPGPVRISEPPRNVLSLSNVPQAAVRNKKATTTSLVPLGEALAPLYQWVPMLNGEEGFMRSSAASAAQPECIIRAKNFTGDDFIYEASVWPGGPDPSVATINARVGPAGAGYNARPDRTGNSKIYRNSDQGQTYTLLSTGPPRSLEGWHEWGMHLHGNTIEYHWDDQFTLSAADATYASGSVGARVYNSGLYLDDVRVRKYASPEPIVTLGQVDTSSGASAPAVVSVESLKPHFGPGPGELGISLTENAGSADVECRMDGPTKIEIVFDGPVHADDGSLDFDDEIAVSSSATGVISLSDLDLTANTLTFTLDGVPDAGCMVLHLHGLASAANGIMDDTDFYLRVLLGDVDGDGQVTDTDMNLLRAQTGPLTPAAFRADLNINGRVTSADVNVVRQHPSAVGLSCP